MKNGGNMAAAHLHNARRAAGLAFTGLMKSRRGAAHDLSVTVAYGGDERRLETAIDSVLEAGRSLDLETIVVGVDDDEVGERIERRFPGVRIIGCPSQSLAHAYNLALDHANASYLLFVGPDVEVCEGDLAGLVSTLERQPEVALAGVRQVDSEGELWPSMRRFPSARHMLAEAIGADRLPGMKRFLGEYELDPRRYERTTACEWTSGVLLVRRAALDGAGWFDQRLRWFAAEADLCLRLRRKGWEVVYVPCLTARRCSKPLRERPRLEAQAAYARMQFARKHFPRASADYRWALALRYALHLGIHSLHRYDGSQRRASRIALATVLRGLPPLEGPYAANPS